MKLQIVYRGEKYKKAHKYRIKNIWIYQEP